MVQTEAGGESLVPIDEVARRFGMKASAIRYYEDRGLLHPTSRHAGRRWYGQRELRRLAIIRYWQQSGLMKLDDIAQILEGEGSDTHWRELIDRQVRSLATQIERMEEARRFLEHVAAHHDRAPDGCDHYEALIWGQAPPSATARPVDRHRAHTRRE